MQNMQTHTHTHTHTHAHTKLHSRDKHAYIYTHAHKPSPPSTHTTTQHHSPFWHVTDGQHPTKMVKARAPRSIPGASSRPNQGKQKHALHQLDTADFIHGSTCMERQQTGRVCVCYCVCVCVCVCAFTCMCACMCLFICVYLHVCVYGRTCLRVCALLF